MYDQTYSIVRTKGMISVIVPESGDPQPLKDILPEWCEICSLHSGPQGWTVSQPDALPEPITVLGNRSIILLYAAEEQAGAANILHDVADQLAELNPHCLVSVIQGSPAHLLAEALESFHAVYVDTSNELKASHESLYLVRRELERNNVVIGHLRSRLNLLKPAPAVMTSFAGPEEQISDGPAVKPGQHITIEQALHCSGYDFSGFDLFVRKRAGKPASAHCQLVELSTLEVIAHWRVDLTASREGWLTFALRDPLAGADMTLGVRITLADTASGQDGLAIGMSRPRIHPPCQINGQVTPGSTLAIRTWQGVLGRPADRQVDPLLPEQVQADFEYVLPPGLVHETQLCRLHTVPYPYFSVRTDGTVLLHPVRSKVASARIPNAIPAGALSVRADVIVTGKAASPVNFALALVRNSSAPEKVEPAVDSETGCLATTGWIKVHEPEASHTLELPLGPVTQTEGDLYLFTRVDGDQSVNHCNAKFLKIYVRMPFWAALPL